MREPLGRGIAARADIDFQDVARAIREAALPSCDLVVGIGAGGAVPASLIAYALGAPLRMVWLNYRGADNKPRYAEPRLEEDHAAPRGFRHALLVDDVSVTGKTLRAAARRLSGARVTTLVLKGTADIVLFPDLSMCVQWPWRPAHM